jgi:hypothetical protein
MTGKGKRRFVGNFRNILIKKRKKFLLRGRKKTCETFQQKQAKPPPKFLQEIERFKSFDNLT